MAHTLYSRPGSDRFLVESLPDGSAAVFDSTSESVHSLNQTAAVVWECCAEPVTLTDIAGVLRRVTGLPEPRAVAEDALNQLESAGLVQVRHVDDDTAPSRRTALLTIARGSSIAFLAPLVQTMTVGQQHVFAQGAGSPVTTTTSAPTTTSSTTTTSTAPTTTSTTTSAAPTTTLVPTTVPATTTLVPTTVPATTTLVPTTVPATTTLVPT